jgi:hypothetical protein
MILVDELWVKPLERGDGRAPVEQIRRSASEGLAVSRRR